MLYAAGFGILAGAMLTFPAQAADAAWLGLTLWARSVAPVLGPFMVCMLMLTSRVGGGMSFRTVLCWLCGSPGGARLMQEARLSGLAALRAAAMTGTMSPMFFLGTVEGWLGKGGSGWLLLGCHIAGAFCLGLCFRAERRKEQSTAVPMPLSAALRESALALLTVALCMMLGCVSSRMAACAFPGLPPGGTAAMQCALEVTAGVKALTQLNPPFALPLVCAACSFGGLSLLMQNAAFWQESGVGLPQLLLLRLAHGLLSGSLCLIAQQLLGYG